jgi:hypothetical protein
LIIEIRSVILSIRSCIIWQMRAYSSDVNFILIHRLNENVDELSVCEKMMRFLVHKTVFSAFEAQTDESRCLVWG